MGESELRSGPISSLRRWWPLTAGFLVLCLCLTVAWRVGTQALQGGIVCQVQQVTVNGSFTDGLGIDVALEVKNRRRLAATFLGVTGTLRVAGTPVSYTVDGIEVGDTVSPGEKRRITIHVQPENLDLLKVAFGAAWNQEIRVDFNGIVRARVIGFSISVPVYLERSIKPSLSPNDWIGGEEIELRLSAPPSEGLLPTL